jgi:hypothetical protein
MEEAKLPLNIDLEINNKRQDCKIGNGEWVSVGRGRMNKGDLGEVI